jgi:hypothetical protein
MKPSRASYTPGNKCLKFYCECGTVFAFKSGIPPRSRELISARCTKCKKVSPYEVRIDKETRRFTGGF